MSTNFIDTIAFIPALIVLGGFLIVIYLLAKKNDSKPVGDLLLIAAANWKNYRGKTNRKDFWITYLSYLLIFSILLAFNIAVLNDTLFVLLPAIFVYSAIILPLASRRLNDTNTSPWWIAVYFSSILVASFLSTNERLLNQNSNYFIALVLVMLISAIWILIKLCSPSYIQNKKTRKI